MKYLNKTIKTFVTFSLILISTLTFGQNNSIRLSTYTGLKFSLEYERKMKGNTSLNIGVKYNHTLENIPLVLDFSPSDHSFKSKNEGLRITADFRKYFFKGKKGLQRIMRGIYFAPNLSVGQHSIYYAKKVGIHYNVAGAGFGSGLQGEYAKGKAKVTAAAIGMKLGVQVDKKKGFVDFGVNVMGNTVLDFGRGITLTDGSVQKYKSDLSGLHAEVYFGLGRSF